MIRALREYRPEGIAAISKGSPSNPVSTTRTIWKNC